MLMPSIDSRAMFSATVSADTIQQSTILKPLSGMLQSLASCYNTEPKVTKFSFRYDSQWRLVQGGLAMSEWQSLRLRGEKSSSAASDQVWVCWYLKTFHQNGCKQNLYWPSQQRCAKA